MFIVSVNSKFSIKFNVNIYITRNLYLMSTTFDCRYIVSIYICPPLVATLCYYTYSRLRKANLRRETRYLLIYFAIDRFLLASFLPIRHLDMQLVLGCVGDIQS